MYVCVLLGLLHEVVSTAFQVGGFRLSCSSVILLVDPPRPPLPGAKVFLLVRMAWPLAYSVTVDVTFVCMLVICSSFS